MTYPHALWTILGVAHLVAGVVLLTLSHPLAGAICLGIGIAGWVLITFMIFYDAISSRKSTS